MPQDFSVRIADADVARVITAISSNYKYKSTIPNPDFDENEEVSESNPETITNPQTPAEFVNEKARQWIWDHVRSYEKKQGIAAVPEPTPVDTSNPHAG